LVAQKEQRDTSVLVAPVIEGSATGKQEVVERCATVLKALCIP